jgi:hypothetical protein
MGWFERKKLAKLALPTSFTPLVASVTRHLCFPSFLSVVVGSDYERHIDRYNFFSEHSERDPLHIPSELTSLHSYSFGASA